MSEKTVDFGVFIMGGGPGDPDLITLRALNVLKRADVILYDNLSNKEPLEFAPESCKKIYVGKQPYGICTQQAEINDLIVENAQHYKVVVRLKGGDPFIFGRGFEEMAFVEARGIKCHYIPGISAMQAAGFIDVPLTHRGISESVWIITGTKKDGSLSNDLKCALTSSATVVIYMGMKKLGEISKVYIEANRGDTPAVIIQHATLPQQRHVICSAGTLKFAAARAGLGYPAIIIIGNVVDARVYATTGILSANWQSETTY